MGALTTLRLRSPKAWLWLLMVAALAGTAASLWRWQQHARLNREWDTGTLKLRALGAEDPAVAYAAGLLHAAAGDTKPAARAYTLAEASPDPVLCANAKVALGNLYFEIAMRSADVASGGSHVGGQAQIELAREAYRSALRVQPQLLQARYNLELLDRLSPPRRTEGWERSTDGVTLAPQKRDGWASMKDNVRRGLP